jgi:hypothetical protein
VSFYGEKVLPRLQDKAMNRQGTQEVRARVCAGLAGKVLEIGFGTGLNVRSACSWPSPGFREHALGSNWRA